MKRLWGGDGHDTSNVPVVVAFGRDVDQLIFSKRQLTSVAGLVVVRGDGGLEQVEPTGHWGNEREEVSASPLPSPKNKNPFIFQRLDSISAIYPPQ